MGDIMISREEKNQVYVDEIRKERTIKVLKIILKIFGIFLLIFSTIFSYAYFVEPYSLKTKEYIIKDNIPDSFNGIKILHLSDLLYGSTIKKDSLENILNEIKLIKPDIVMFTGNIISKDYSISEKEISYLNSFFSDIPYTIGKYTIKGDKDNHSFDLIMENSEFNILDNCIELYNNDNVKINLIGINYNENKDIQNNEGYTITLINNYDDYKKYSINSNLVLAGHNFGGEMRLFNAPLIGTDKHLNNYYQEGNTKIYISNGLGTIHHLRFMNKPSMNVYRLYTK